MTTVPIIALNAHPPNVDAAQQFNLLYLTLIFPLGEEWGKTSISWKSF